MKVLVAYATRHGATRGIAERLAQAIERRGLDVTLQPAETADPAGYDAFIIGSAAYMGHWLKDAADFVRRHRGLFATRPVWLFSSGPIGTEMVDEKGRDVLETGRPEEFTEFKDILPREERVFFGAYDPDAEPVGMMERLGAWFTRMPAIRSQLPAGDYRDWPAIEAWADGIASQLTEDRAAAPTPA